jgi:hypothetical protein
MIWLTASQLSPEFNHALSAEWHRYFDIPCWEWDDMYCGHPLG